MKKTLISSCMIAFLASGIAGCSEDKDTPQNDTPEVVKKANDEVCGSAEDCLSGYCSPLKRCAAQPVEHYKNNGEHCFSGTECISYYCSTSHECANPPVVLKGKGDHCDNAEECATGYCNDAHACADKPVSLKNKGEHCDKGEECVTGYCNDDHECADKPVSLKNKGEHCDNGEECVTGYCNADQVCADKPSGGEHVLDLQEVPANQNNTKGAECDPNTFVEHCRGSNMVLCKYDDVKKKGKVTLDECNTGDTCNLTLIDGKNYPGCIGESWACQQGDSGEKACDTDDLGYELLRVYSCVLFDDGNYYQVYTETYCAGACSTKKCEPESCDPLVSKCSDDLQYTLECNEIAPGKYIYKASNCKDFDASCTTYLDPKTDKTWAYCGGDPI